MKIKSKTVIVKNTININKTTDYLPPRIIDHKNGI